MENGTELTAVQIANLTDRGFTSEQIGRMNVNNYNSIVNGDITPEQYEAYNAGYAGNVNGTGEAQITTGQQESKKSKKGKGIVKVVKGTVVALAVVAAVAFVGIWYYNKYVSPKKGNEAIVVDPQPTEKTVQEQQFDFIYGDVDGVVYVRPSSKGIADKSSLKIYEEKYNEQTQTYDVIYEITEGTETVFYADSYTGIKDHKEYEAGLKNGTIALANGQRYRLEGETIQKGEGDEAHAEVVPVMPNASAAASAVGRERREEPAEVEEVIEDKEEVEEQQNGNGNVASASTIGERTRD